MVEVIIQCTRLTHRGNVNRKCVLFCLMEFEKQYMVDRRDLKSSYGFNFEMVSTGLSLWFGYDLYLKKGEMY